MQQASRREAPPVNPCTEHDHAQGDDCPSHPFFTFGQAVTIAAPPVVADGIDAGRDPASPMARRHHGRLGIIIGAQRCDRETVPRMLYSIAIYPAIQVRLYACELQRYDGAPSQWRAGSIHVCHHGFPPDIECPECDAFKAVDETGGDL